MSDPLVLLEHLNLNIPDVDLARVFYVKGLGCQENIKQDRTRLLHVNMGLSQMHLPYRFGPVDRRIVKTAQVVNGWIEFGTAENVADLVKRLDSMDALRGKIKITPETDTTTWVQGPFGNLFHIVKVKSEESRQILAAGTHPCGSHKMVSLRKVVLACPPGSASSIARFYNTYLFCNATMETPTRCVVPFAHNQKLVFEESTKSFPSTAYDTLETQKFHVAIYVDSEEKLEQAFRRATKENLVYINPRFEGGPMEFASSKTEEDVLKTKQFRLKDIPLEGSTNKMAFQLEHEVRSPQHTAFPIGKRSANL